MVKCLIRFGEGNCGGEARGNLITCDSYIGEDPQKPVRLIFRSSRFSGAVSICQYAIAERCTSVIF